MFTGIIEEMGKIKQLKRGENSAKVIIDADVVLKDVHLGDSIAVNGICLTVVRYGDRFFEVDVMAETLRKTNLGQLQPGSLVNLERALRVGDRLGGHIVSGHIDGIGIIKSQTREDIAIVTEIKAPSEVMKYVVPKGSIAIDGTSLTVVGCTDENFTISLIPHTAKLTTLGYKGPGDMVNLEADILGKYIERISMFQNMDKNKKNNGITAEFLLENGFM